MTRWPKPLTVILAASGSCLALAGCGSGGEAIGAAESVRLPVKPKTVHMTIEVNGDLLIHSPIFTLAHGFARGRGYDFRPMLREIKPIVSAADLAVCHVETPMTGRRPTGFPLFNTPPALASAIKATGWDACDTASNHTLDQGQTGVDSTIAQLNRAGVRHTGSWSSADAARRPLIITAKNGVKVGWLAYTEMTNGIPLPKPWSVGLASAPRILADARRARAAGAQAVIVNLHAGEEYQSEPSRFQSDLARRLTASPDITAIVGQHVHVVQPIRKVRGKFVVYGEGNLLSNQTPSCCPARSQDGLIAILHLSITGARSSVDRVDYIPVWVRHPDFTVLPVRRALQRRLAPASELRASWKRTTSVVGSSVARPR